MARTLELDQLNSSKPNAKSVFPGICEAHIEGPLANKPPIAHLVVATSNWLGDGWYLMHSARSSGPRLAPAVSSNRRD